MEAIDCDLARRDREERRAAEEYQEAWEDAVLIFKEDIFEIFEEAMEV